MIEELQNNQIDVARQIRSIFQVSYKVEAQLLNASDFPPLKRTLESFLESGNKFYGFIEDEKYKGIVEIKSDKNCTLIRSLVVDPQFFRKGIASHLLNFTLSKFDSKLFVVETGLNNFPAIKLYEKFGFSMVSDWDTDHGVRKVKFELKRPTEFS